MIKKILSAVLTLVLGVGSGFLLWLVAMDGTEKLEDKIRHCLLSLRIYARAFTMKALILPGKLHMSR